MPNPVNEQSAEHYTWGERCHGWYLFKSPHLLVIKELMPPGTAETLHLHKYATQHFQILKGTAEMIVAGQSHTLNEGDGLTISPNTPHQIKNTSQQEVTFLAISSPNAQQDRFESEPTPM